MNFKRYRQKWIKKVRFLTLSLIISGALNILLLVVFLYSTLKEKQIYVSISKPLTFLKKQEDISNLEYLSFFTELSFRELALLLSDKELLEDGYMKRDLALACLVKMQDFNIEKALPGYDLQVRQVAFVKNHEKNIIDVFANFSDYHYEKIIHFINTEKWPFTSKGVFYLLKKYSSQKDPSLKQAFFLTGEFYQLKSLFNQTNIKNEYLLEIILDGTWDMLEQYIDNSHVSNISEQRIEFLFDYIQIGSKSAAKILLQTDFIYAKKKLDDNQILQVLDLIEEKSDDIEQFLCELLKSSRSDAVWKKSASILYKFSGEEYPQEYNHQTSLEKFVLSDELKDKWQTEEIKKATLSSIIYSNENQDPNIHIVKDGDTLWKIARIYKVEIDELIQMNNLDNDKILPGKEMVISR